MKTLSLSTMQKTGTLQVDREGGIIKGIAAMTMGLTKESNCGQFMVDATTLAQAAEAINAHENGIQCRVTHPELTGADGFIELVGKISNAEVVGDQVKVDFALGSYASDDDKRRIFGLAEDAPEDAGLSIVSKSHDFDDVDGELCLRINSMHAVDWTGEPAANTAGMLSAQNKLALAKGTEIMNDAQMELLRSWGLDPEADEATVAEFIAQLDEEKQGELKAAGEVVAEAAEAPAEPVAAAAEEDEKPVAAAADPPKEEEEEDKPVAAGAKVDVISFKDIDAIKDVCLLAGKTAEDGIALARQGFTKDQITSQMIATAAKERTPIAMSAKNHNIQVGEDNQRVSLHAGLRDAILLRAAPAVYGNRTDDDKIHARAHEFENLSLSGIGRKYLALNGVKNAWDIPKGQVVDIMLGKRQAFRGVALAQSTSDLPDILLDAMNKALRVSYNDAASTWEKWALRNVADDFKDIHSIALSEAPDLELITEGGTVKYAFMEDSKETYALDEYVGGLRLTRRNLINDDMKAFNTLPQKQAVAAKRKEDDVVYAILTANPTMSDGNALFSSAHDNLAGTGTVFSVTSLDLAYAAMFDQMGPLGDAYLELEPEITLIPAQINGVVSQIINGTVVPGANEGHSHNNYTNALDIIKSSRLGANSTTAWYLAMGANNGQVGTVELSFLRGEESPVLEQETDFDTGDAKFKVRHTVAAQVTDHRGLYKNPGA